MKTFLLSGLFLASFLFTSNRTQAQCTVSDIIVQNIVVISGTATSCTVKFDVTFNIADNSGNKFIFIHAWLQNDYPNYFKCENGQTTQNGTIAAPKQADLVKSFLNIGLDNLGATPVPLTSYPADAAVPMATMDSASKQVLPDGTATITLYGVLTTSPVACTTPSVVVVDLWSSQAASAQRAHCVNCGIRSTAGYLSVFGFVNCFSNSFTGAIGNSTAAQVDGFYRVFADVNNDGYFTPTTDTLLITNTTFSVAGMGSVPIAGSIPAANVNQNIFIVITQTTGNASGASRVFMLQQAPCGPLPVTFGSVSANRMNQSSVLVKWETVTEENTRGFIVQSKQGNDVWKQSAFVPSRSTAGNSSLPLSYSFTDMNSSRGLTQYRIQQIDYDGKTSISETRVVRGEGQNGNMIIYPNPSSNGRVMVVFDESKVIRDMLLVDMYGKQVRQWRGVSDNTLQIDNLVTGMYTLKVIARESGEQTTTKIIVSKN